MKKLLSFITISALLLTQLGLAARLSIKDDTMQFVNGSDHTKITRLDLSGVSAGAVRTLTLPDMDGTIALTSQIVGGGFPNPMTGLGDLIYGGSGGAASRLAGYFGTTKRFLSQTGDGVNSAAPVWSLVTKSDVGLGNVENTTLSTWPGTSNITTVGSITSGVWAGSIIDITKGGTNANNAVSAFNNLAPTTTLGDIIYNDGTNNVRLAGNNSTTKRFLSQTGDGTNSAPPVWDTISSGSAWFADDGATPSPLPSVDASALRSIAIGQNATVPASINDALAIGTNASVTSSPYTVAIGRNALASGDSSLTLGSSVNFGGGLGRVSSTGLRSIAIGSVNANGTGATEVKATSFGSIALGSITQNSGSAQSVQASGEAAIAIGAKTVVGSPGNGPQATNTGAIAVGGTTDNGNAAVASGLSAIAFGNTVYSSNGPQATGLRSVALGSAAGASDPGPISSGADSFAFGASTNATAAQSVAIGNGANADKYGQVARANGKFSSNGDAQSSNYILRGQTTNNTQTEIALDNATNYITITPGQTYAFEVKIVAKRTGGSSGTGLVDDSAYFIRSGLIKNSAGTTGLIGSVDTLGTDKADTGASIWSVSVTADDTNDRLAIKVTGDTDMNINWVATVSIVETK